MAPSVWAADAASQLTAAVLLADVPSAFATQTAKHAVRATRRVALIVAKDSRRSKPNKHSNRRKNGSLS